MQFLEEICGVWVRGVSWFYKISRNLTHIIHFYVVDFHMLVSWKHCFIYSVKSSLGTIKIPFFTKYKTKKTTVTNPLPKHQLQIT